jgi:2-isopropylmalate synthase
LKSFAIQSLSRGQDALGEVSILADFGGGVLGAKGSDTDIVVASAKAYLNALNRHLAQGRAPRGRRR